MRDFFMDWAERLLVLFAVLTLLAVVVAGVAAAGHPYHGSFGRGAAIILGGGLYVVVTAGLMFVVFGIYRNTQETNRLLSRQSRQ